MSCRTCWEQARSGSAAATNHCSMVFGSTSHARRAADAQAFSEAREHACDEPNGGAFAMDEGAEGLETRATTDDTQQLPPGTALGMAIGAEMPPAHPATRGTVQVRANRVPGVHLALAATGGGEP